MTAPTCAVCNGVPLEGEALCARCAFALPTAGQAHADAGDTEVAAAVMVAPRTGTLRCEVLATLGAYEDGLTAEQLATVMKRRHYSVAPRITELRDGGWVQDSGERRPTTSSAPAIVWALTEKAWRQLPTILRGAA